MTTDAGGGDLKRLMTGFVRGPAIAPSGKRIVFEGIPTGKPKTSYGLWTIRRDGSHLQRLTRPAASVYDETPDWSPDGRDVAFLRCRTDASTHGCIGSLEVVAADGAHRHPIRAVVGEAYPAYAPNGARIALTSGSESCSGIFTVNTAGGDPREVTHYCDPPGHGGFASAPSWQPLP
jgi:Tol biopolymer transport system component